ncbi:MAG: hypothetical protein ACM3MK_08485 [Chitinophagales bacterium]
MQLPKGERAILSYYRSYAQAMEAVQELHKAGFDGVQIDTVSRSGLYNEYSDYPGGYTVNQYPYNPAANVAWGPRQSAGMLSPTFPSDGCDYMVTSIIPSTDADLARSIISKYADYIN